MKKEKPKILILNEIFREAMETGELYPEPLIKFIKKLEAARDTYWKKRIETLKLYKTKNFKL